MVPGDFCVRIYVPLAQHLLDIAAASLDLKFTAPVVTLKSNVYFGLQVIKAC